MRKPWDISGDELSTWASRVEAASMLPKLVRRLLFATAPRAAIEIRADGGMWLGGLDGIVRAREATAFCPAGLSVWEMSVKQKFKSKLDGDFSKRSGAVTLPIQPKEATYVAVIAHRVVKKHEWAEQQQALRRWADVRVIDADDLASWLEQAPAVVRWFAEELGKPVGDLRDIEALLSAWRLRTSPPLPWALVLAGEERKRQAGELLEGLDGPPGRPLLVRGETREEALLFAAAALKEHPHGESWLSRALVVESVEALRWALSVQTAEPLIVLVAFEGADPGQAATARAQVILAGDGRTPALPRATLDLAPIPWNPMAEVLTKAGFKEIEAKRLVQEASGSLAKLQALCGYIELPDWAKGFPAPELLAFLLAGAWTPTNDADREVLRQLGGDPDAVDRLCKELEKRGDVESIGEAWGPSGWKWKTPRVAWKQLGDRLTETQVDRFQAVVLDVLGALDPVYELPKFERFHAPITGHVLPHSSALRLGLALSIVMLSQSDLHVRDARQRSRGSELIYRLFPAERGWKPWASLSGLLPTLAEAAPEAFLDVVERSLDQGADGVAHLFAEEGGSSGPTPHVDLLWALEALGWSPDKGTMLRVAFALARLAAYDKEGGAPGKVANRPGRSLAKLLHKRCPQSRSSVEDRLQVIETLLNDEDDEVCKIGWDVGLDMLGFLQGMFIPSRQTEYLWERLDALREVSNEEMFRQQQGAANLLLAHVGVEELRWKGLLDLILQMPQELAQQVLDTLEKTRATFLGSTGAIRSALRERLQWGGKRAQEIDPAILGRLNSLYKALTPDDLIERHAWLFSHKINLLPESVEGGWKEEEKQKDILRQQALAELWPLPDRWDKLVALSKVVEEPWTIGVAVAGTAFADEMEEHLLSRPRRELDAGVLRAFFGKRFETRGEVDGLPWIKQVILRLLEGGRREEAVQVAHSLPSGKPIWDMIDELGEPLRSEYWQKMVGGPYGDHPPESWERAASNLLSAGNVLVALHTARTAGDKLSAATAVRVLERLRELPPNERRSKPEFMLGHSIARVLERIERAPSIHPAKTLKLEIDFLDVLDDPSRLQRHLSTELAEHPGLFVQLLQAMYRREGEAPLPEGEEAQRVRRAAEAAYDTISSWNGYPGALLAPEEREARIEAWASEVLDAASADGRGGPASSHVAEVLARAPEGPDGLWPCLAARRLLRKRKYPLLRDSLEIAQKNRRRVTVGGLLEGGDQERAVANAYREAAQQMQDEFPETAILLDSLARAYDDEAAPWDAKARRHRIEYGEADEAPAPPAAHRPVEGEPVGASLSFLEFRGVGPAPVQKLELAPRLNLVTGDNSLGKTLVLDILWWCLTGSFAQPDRLPKPGIKVRNGKVLKNRAAILARAGDRAITGTYSALHERWSMLGGPPLCSGLAIYARVDGGFSVWDPIRNAAPRDKDEVDLSKGYHFSQPELWEGLFAKRSTRPLCNGLITDAVRWKSERPRAYELLAKALEELSPPHEKLEFGLPKRFSVKEDARDHPVLLLPYGPIFAVHASSAVQRILGLAYALVWAVTEIEAAAKVARRTPISSVTMLIDEVEAHLHPKWQRTILRALLTVVDKIALEAKVQLIVTTHAPLVLASVEQRFDSATDAFFDFTLPDVQKGEEGPTPTPVVRKEPWIIRGDVNAWLGSRVFDRTEPRSPDAESALKAAKEALENPDTDRKQGRKVHRMLQKALSDIDPFWLRWRYLAEQRGWVS